MLGLVGKAGPTAPRDVWDERLDSSEVTDL